MVFVHEFNDEVDGEEAMLEAAWQHSNAGDMFDCNPDTMASVSRPNEDE
jgi:hypothetical protein